MKRSELKQLIKECLVELLTGAADSSVTNISQRPKAQQQTLASHMGSQPRRQQVSAPQRGIKRNPALDAPALTFEQRVSKLARPVNVFNDSTLDSIAGDTMRTTLMEQNDADGNDPTQQGIPIGQIGVYEDDIPVPDGADAAAYYASRADPASLGLDEKWAKLTFGQ
jgi:hypothetical protein